MARPVIPNLCQVDAVSGWRSGTQSGSVGDNGRVCVLISDVNESVMPGGSNFRNSQAKYHQLTFSIWFI